MVRLHLDSGAIMRYANFRKVESLVEAFFIGWHMITQERLKELLDYDETTGMLTWKVTSRRAISGSVAGTISSSGGRNGYFAIKIDNIKYQAHRLVWLYVHGKFPPNEIDHMDGNRANNRLTNLRAVTHAQNGQNRNPQRNSSGHRGVTWNKSANKWMARVGHNGKQYQAGYFINIEDAVAAAKALRNKLFTHHIER